MPLSGGVRGGGSASGGQLRRRRQQDAPAGHVGGDPGRRDTGGEAGGAGGVWWGGGDRVGGGPAGAALLLGGPWGVPPHTSRGQDKEPGRPGSPVLLARRNLGPAGKPWAGNRCPAAERLRVLVPAAGRLGGARDVTCARRSWTSSSCGRPSPAGTLWGNRNQSTVPGRGGLPHSRGRTLDE